MLNPALLGWASRRVAFTLEAKKPVSGSDRDWQPAQDGQGDDRRLAFRLVDLRLRH